MLFADVNVLVYAHRPEAPRHEEYHAFLSDALGGDEPLAVTPGVLAGFVRVVTHPRVFRDPTPLETALEFAETVQSAPSSLTVGAGERTWSILVDLVRQTEARGNAVPDALIAAQAIEHGATLVTADRGFARFPRLSWRHPLD